LDRKTEAKAILTNPLYIEAFEELKNQLTNEWRQTNDLEIERREALYIALKLADRVHTHFTSVLEDGEIAYLYEQSPHI
jgi:hypothetical protein